MDLYGYPTVYFAPPFESVDRLEFIRGGASLMYGPQPSGALNYVTHQPRRDRPFALRTQHVLGSYGLYTTHTLIDGTDPAAALLDFARKCGADLIVMGSHGRTGLGRLLLGSVAEKVIGAAICPVLVVKA